MDPILAELQSRFGSVDYSQWQTIRQPFYSSVQYPLAGQARLTFFGQAVGAQNLQLTNMPKAGSFGQVHYIAKSIRFGYFIAAQNATWPATTADLDTLASDFLAGFYQAGALEFIIGQKKYLELPKPFLTAPQGTGKIEFFGAGQTAGAPASTPAPYVSPASATISQFIFDPQIFIAAEQQFEVTISYPSGLVPVIATGPVTAGNPLFITCWIDGVLIRPVQ